MTDKDWYRARWVRERKLHKIWRAIARRRATIMSALSHEVWLP